MPYQTAELPVQIRSHMGTREEKKAQTRNKLMDSVLAIIGVGANFASISLREVAKTAGVVPTSFYRHFGDMEELGLSIVDELGLKLRRLMRGSFNTAESDAEMIRQCVETYFDYVLDNANVFQFVNQSRTGGTPSLQDAIRDEMKFVTDRISTELRQIVPDMTTSNRDTVASLIVSGLMESTTQLLAIPEENAGQQDELREQTINQMQVVLLGARHSAENLQFPATKQLQ